MLTGEYVGIPSVPTFYNFSAKFVLIKNQEFIYFIPVFLVFGRRGKEVWSSRPVSASVVKASLGYIRSLLKKIKLQINKTYQSVI